MSQILGMQTVRPSRSHLTNRTNCDSLRSKLNSMEEFCFENIYSRKLHKRRDIFRETETEKKSTCTKLVRKKK